MKTETSKTLLENKLSSLIQALKINFCLKSYKIKKQNLSLKLKGYKILFKGKRYRITRLQERKDYKSLSKGERGYLLSGSWNLKLEN